MPFPLFHWAGWHLLTDTVHRRSTTHLVSRVTASAVVDAVERWRAHRIYCIPGVWTRVLDHVAAAPGRLGSLRAADTGTSRVEVDLLDRLRHAVPQAAISVSYGSTEAGSVAGLGPADLFRKPGSVGPPRPATELRITDGGEVAVRSPFLMSGYFDRPEETAAVLRDGWYLSGDVGSLDADGYLSIDGRVREVIRSGGETIAPPEVEAALADHPAVEDVAVVGLPDPDWGEVVCAAVVLAPGAESPTVADLRAHVDGRLTAPKHPRRLVVVDALPRTAATGQIQRSRLRRQLVDTEGAGQAVT